MVSAGQAAATGPDTAAGAIADVVRAHVRDVEDFPRPGVVFKDISPLLASPSAFAAVVDAIARFASGGGATKLAAIEARGFLFAAPVAYRIGAGVVPVRKQGKLPGQTIGRSYDLEYGSATLEVQRDAFAPGDRVLLVDDVLATGGTAAAAAELIASAGASVLALSVLLELTFLPGRERVSPLPVHALLPV
jgi:adenine phosphoribosyltransferase